MIQIKDKQFVPFISEEELQLRVAELGQEINSDYLGKTPIMIGIMNGAFMFLSDLVRHIDLPLEISFIRISSYEAMSSTGNVKTLLGLDKDLEGKDVIVVEDIIDSGLSMSYILDLILGKNPSSLQVASLLLKPGSLQKDISAKYLGFEIPNKFVVGYGLDYDGFGRNLKEIYQLR